MTSRSGVSPRFSRRGRPPGAFDRRVEEGSVAGLAEEAEGEGGVGGREPGGGSF